MPYKPEQKCSGPEAGNRRFLRRRVGAVLVLSDCRDQAEAATAHRRVNKDRDKGSYGMNAPEMGMDAAVGEGK
jgi:hypothetical protein